MVITVYDTDREPVGVIDQAYSLIWTERYSEPGDFELVVDLSQTNLDLLTLDYYISIPESDTWMIIETRKRTIDTQDGNKLTVSGRSLIALFDRRYLPDNAAFGLGGVPPIYYRADFVMGVFVGWAYNYGAAERKVDYITYEYSTDTRITDPSYSKVELSVEYRTGRSSESALQKLLSIGYLWGTGIRMEPNDDGEFVVTVYMGENRTRGQSTNWLVIFSPAFDNLESSEYIESSLPEKSFLYVWSAPQPAPVLIVTRENASAPTGIDMKEGHLDASFLSPYQADGTTPKSTAERTTDQEQAGDIELSQATRFRYISGKILDRTFHFGEHYFLGDLVQVEDGYGGSGYARVTEVTHNFDETGYQLYPTLEFYEN